MNDDVVVPQDDTLEKLSKLCGWDHICGHMCHICEVRKAKADRDIELNTFASLPLDEV